MALGQHLQQRYDELQEQYNLLSEEIQFLRGKERTDDLSPRELFRLKKQVEEAETERKAIEQQLEELEKTSGSEQLYRALLSLGYRQQIRLFRKLIEAESVAAYLIHGLPDYGQRWLLNRLVVQYVPHFMTGKVVKVDLARRGRRIDVSTLWRELGGHMGLRGSQSSPSMRVVQRVCRLPLLKDWIQHGNRTLQSAHRELLNFPMRI